MSVVRGRINWPVAPAYILVTLTGIAAFAPSLDSTTYFSPPKNHQQDVSSLPFGAGQVFEDKNSILEAHSSTSTITSELDGREESIATKTRTYKHRNKAGNISSFDATSSVCTKGLFSNELPSVDSIQREFIKDGKYSTAFEADLVDDGINPIFSFVQLHFNPFKSKKFKDVSIEYKDKILYFLNEKRENIAKFTIEKAIPRVVQTLISLTHSKGSKCTAEWVHKHSNKGVLHLTCDLDYGSSAYSDSSVIKFKCHKPKLEGFKKESFSIDPPLFSHQYPTYESILSHMRMILGLSPKHPISITSVNGHKVTEKESYNALTDAISSGRNEIDVLLDCAIQVSVRLFLPFIQAPDNISTYPVFLYLDDYKRVLLDTKYQSLLAESGITGNPINFKSSANTSSIYYLSDVDKHKCRVKKGKLVISPNSPKSAYEIFTFIPQVSVNVYLMEKKKFTTTISPLMMVKDVISELNKKVSEYAKDIKEIKKHKIVFYGFEVGNCQLHDLNEHIYEKTSKLLLYKIPTSVPCATTKSTVMNFYFGPHKPSEILLDIYINNDNQKSGPYKIHIPYEGYATLQNLKEIIVRNLSLMGVFLSEDLQFVEIGGKPASHHSDRTHLSAIKEFIQDYRRNVATTVTITPNTNVNARFVGSKKTNDFKFHINSTNPTSEEIAKAFEEKAHKNKYMSDHLHHNLLLLDKEDNGHLIDFQDGHLPRGINLNNIIFEGDNNKDLKINYTDRNGKISEFTLFLPYKMEPQQVQSQIKSELAKRGLLDPNSSDIILDENNFWDDKNPVIHVYSSNTMPIHGFYKGRPVETSIKFKSNTPLSKLETMAKEKVANMLGDNGGMQGYDFSILSDDGEHTYTNDDTNYDNYSISFGTPLTLNFGKKKYCFINHNGEKRCTGIYPNMLKKFTLDTLEDHLRHNSKMDGDKIPENVKLSAIVLNDGKEIPCEYLFGSETIENLGHYYNFDLADVAGFKFGEMNKEEINVLNAFHQSGDLLKARIMKLTGEKETISTLLNNMDIKAFKNEVLDRFSTLDYRDKINNIEVNGKAWKNGMLFSMVNPEDNRDVRITFEVANDSGRKAKTYISSLLVQPKDDDTITTFFKRAFASPVVYGLRPNESYRLDCIKGGKSTQNISTSKMFSEIDCDSISLQPLGVSQDGLPHIVIKDKQSKNQQTISGGIDHINLGLRNYFSDLLDSGSNLESAELELLGIPFNCNQKIWYSHNLLASLTLDSLLAHCSGDFEKLKNKLQNESLMEIKIKPKMGNYVHSDTASDSAYPLMIGLSLNGVPTQVYTKINVTKTTIKDRPTEFVRLINQTFGKSLEGMSHINVNLWISNTLRNCTKFDGMKGLLNMSVNELLRHCNVTWQMLEMTGGADINVDVIKRFASKAYDGTENSPNRILLNMSSGDDYKMSSIPSKQNVQGELQDFLMHNGGQDVMMHPEKYVMNVSIDHREPQLIPVSELLPQSPYSPHGVRNYAGFIPAGVKRQGHLGPNSGPNKTRPSSRQASFFDNPDHVPRESMDIILERLPDGADSDVYFSHHDSPDSGTVGSHMPSNGQRVAGANKAKVIMHRYPGPEGMDHLLRNNWLGSPQNNGSMMHGGWSVEVEFPAEQLISDYENISNTIVTSLKSKLGGRLDLVSNAIVLVNVNGNSYKCDISNLSQFEEMDTSDFLEKCVPIEQLAGNPNVTIRVEYDPFNTQFIDADKLSHLSNAKLIIPTLDDSAPGTKVLDLGHLSNTLPGEAVSALNKYKGGFQVVINGVPGDCFIPSESITTKLTPEVIIDHCGVDDPISQSFTIQLLPYRNTGNPFININVRERDGDGFSDKVYHPWNAGTAAPSAGSTGDIKNYKGKINFDTTTLNDIVRDAASHEPVNVMIYQNNIPFGPGEIPERLGNIPLSSLSGEYNISLEYDPTGVAPGTVSAESLANIPNLRYRLMSGDLGPGDRVYLCNEHSHVPIDRVPEHLLHIPGSDLHKRGYTIQIVRGAPGKGMGHKNPFLGHGQGTNPKANAGTGAPGKGMGHKNPFLGHGQGTNPKANAGTGAPGKGMGHKNPFLGHGQGTNPKANAGTEAPGKGMGHKNPFLGQTLTRIASPPSIRVFSNLIKNSPLISSLQTPIHKILNLDEKTANDAKSIKLAIDGMPSECEIAIGSTDWIFETLESLLHQCNIRDLDHNHQIGIFIKKSGSPDDIEFSLNGSKAPASGDKNKRYKLNLTSSLGDTFEDLGINNLGDNNSQVLLGVKSGNKERLIDVDKDSFAALLKQHPSVLDVLLKFGVPEEGLTSTHSLRIIMESLSKALELLKNNGIQMEIEIDGVDIEQTNLHLTTKLSNIFKKMETLKKLLSEHHNMVLHVQLASGRIIEFTITAHDLIHAIDGGLTLRDLLLHGLDADNVDTVTSILLSPQETSLPFTAKNAMPNIETNAKMGKRHVSKLATNPIDSASKANAKMGISHDTKLTTSPIGQTSKTGPKT
ncbi:hypothetical protein BmR1_04g08360 [Babesia microti strain RI]|uniref:Uncharacterized protein n=1 Tax=Babesia microti (strain RI) TaxID=1133968 RepID=I7J9F4_BABMR|nr:hypothetical protein BmR1_04g08360 [Babesia microti strain RI]CCF75853.1 hypothetical protein BmR1_04g08360 [Babesia microti strain RI]|eukprot:XP_012650261.1 hypothetical protein BmR1_04g08360 [Babesia microti strain RI]